ncbi:M48 family metalloprotease [candidate division WOR-3 bacterium]|nr:M48 family metalloprotease [candidate division WOR-3 bacterium]
MKILLVVPILLVLVIGCVTTGPGGTRSLILIPTQTEVELGKEVVKEIESTETVLNNAQVQNYVSIIGNKIAKVCDRKDVKYTFKVLDNEEINAFACPGGFIYIYKGLMKKMDNEAQLAAVLAHEVGHVVARHSVKRLQAIYGYSIVMEVALGDKMSNAARQMIDAATGVVLLGYGRENEYQADEYGILYAKKAGYNPRGMIQVFEKFKQMEGQPPNTFQKLLMSHPPASDRISNGNREIQTVGGTGLPYYESEYVAIRSLLQ